MSSSSAQQKLTPVVLLQVLNTVFFLFRVMLKRFTFDFHVSVKHFKFFMLGTTSGTVPLIDPHQQDRIF
jgi:hypothetical protein